MMNLSMAGVLIIVAVLVLVCVTLWTRLVKLTTRLAAKEFELDRIRGEYDQLLAKHQTLIGQMQDEIGRRSVAETRATRIKELESHIQCLNEESRASHERIVELTSKLADSEAKREDESKHSEEKLALLTEARTQLGVQFENVANKILDEKTKKFTEQNKSNLELLLSPLGAQINEFKQRVNEVYEKESKERFSLGVEIEKLRNLNERMDQDAIELTNALKGQSKTLGNWGEFILEDILQKAGLIKDREYIIRETFIAEDGKRSQPDVVINLPDERHLIIDSKANLMAYNRYCSAEDRLESEQELKKHVAAIRVHVKELDLRRYQDHYKLNSLDFVLMFIPLEPAFIAAVRQDSNLFDDAFSKRIVVVCPSTLLATMRTVANIWKQEHQKQNVLEIANQSGALYDKFVAFYEDLKDIGNRLAQTQNSYEAACNKLIAGKGNLVRRANQILQLGAKASKRLPSSVVAAAHDLEDIDEYSSVQDGLFPELMAEGQEIPEDVPTSS
jgi:DNA recombination protein RmuC